MGRLVSVANTGLTRALSSLDATLTKNKGGGSVMANQESNKDSSPERPSGARDLLPLLTPMSSTNPWKPMSFLTVLTVEQGRHYAWKLPTGASGRLAGARDKPRRYACSCSPPRPPPPSPPHPPP